MKKLWEGRFKESINKLAEEFNASIGFDYKLYAYDILGSQAHAKMLGAVGILTADESETIISALDEIKQEIENGEFEFVVSKEDIHTHIEHRLVEKTSDIGKKLHTARSRNDQVALDIRLYCRSHIDVIKDLLGDMQKALIALADRNSDVVMPGFTHLQHAQPVLFAHHMLAYVNKFDRDKERFSDIYKRVNVLPLGSGALAGTSLPIDREMVAETLGFDAVSDNSMDGVSDRDFIIEILAAASIAIMHISRISEELILWMSKEYEFIDIGDAFCTGSSLMPNKKNPDMAELARGKTGRIYGNLISMLTVLKGLPMTYNKDMQEDKEPLFDTVETIETVLRIFTAMLGAVTVNKENIEAHLSDEFLLATDIVEYLVRKGEPFRSAHHIVGSIVGLSAEYDSVISKIPLEKLKEFSDKIDNEIYDVIDFRKSVDIKVSYGSTGSEVVSANIAKWKERLGM